MFDVVVIGGGVIGGCILRELTKYELSVCMVEAADDVCMGQSKANSGIVHAGFDAEPGTLKARFNVLGSKGRKRHLYRRLGLDGRACRGLEGKNRRSYTLPRYIRYYENSR